MRLQKPAWARAARQGPLRRHKKLVYFACEGLIALYDERSEKEDYSVLTPGDMEERAEALGAMAKKMSVDDRHWMRAEGRRLLADCQGLLDTVKEARYMGDPSDPAVQVFWSKARRNAGVSFSPRADAAGYPQLPPLPLGPSTGRAVTPDQSVPASRLRQLPRRRELLETPS